MKTNELLGFNMFLATQVAAAHDNKGAVRLLLEKGFVLYSNPDLGIIEATIRVDPKETGNKGRTAMDIATERGSMEVVELLWEAIGEEIPDKVKLLQLSRAMYKDDKEEAKAKFKELLITLTPELVRFSRDGFFTGNFASF